MSEYMFAVSSRPVPPRVAKRRDKIAREVGGPDWGYISVRLPDGPRSWGFGPNLGHPFNARMAKEIGDAWARAGVGL